MLPELIVSKSDNYFDSECNCLGNHHHCSIMDACTTTNITSMHRFIIMQQK